MKGLIKITDINNEEVLINLDKIISVKIETRKVFRDELKHCVVFFMNENYAPAKICESKEEAEKYMENLLVKLGN